MKNFYITTPLYYVNASPHIGHSYTTIAADCLTRYMRQLDGKDNVWLLTGTDEYGQKIQRAALTQGLEQKEFVDAAAGRFKELWKILNISYNDFIRTTEERHRKTVQRAIEILYKKELNGEKLIYSAEHEGFYCTPCETFWMPAQLQDLICPDCKRPLEKINETNYFFRLSCYQDWLIEHIVKNPSFIRPETRRHEILSFLTLNKLTDLCISRPKERLSWGIPLPFSSGHVIYVWFDALLNYISAVGSFNEQGKYESKLWPADLQFIGKDILRQHAVYWPIMLHALEIELPKTIFAHGWWMVGRDKMSKSRGNVINPIDMTNKFGVDAYRYFLLRDVPFGLDGSFSETAFIKRFNSDLANDLGNLVYRTLTMIEKYFAGEIPQDFANFVIAKNAQANDILEKLNNSDNQLDREVKLRLRIADCDFSLILEEIWVSINMANKYIEDTKPWNLYKENKIDELKEFIFVLIKVIRDVQMRIYPFMPQTAESIGNQIGENKIKKDKPLFPRIELEKE